MLYVKLVKSNAGDMGSIPGEGKGNPFQYSCLENFMDREAWPVTMKKPPVTMGSQGLHNGTHMHIHIHQAF